MSPCNGLTTVACKHRLYERRHPYFDILEDIVLIFMVSALKKNLRTFHQCNGLLIYMNPLIWRLSNLHIDEEKTGGKRDVIIQNDAKNIADNKKRKRENGINKIERKMENRK